MVSFKIFYDTIIEVYSAEKIELPIRTRPRTFGDESRYHKSNEMPRLRSAYIYVCHLLSYALYAIKLYTVK